jgi:hypothetical protein
MTVVFEVGMDEARAIVEEAADFKQLWDAGHLMELDQAVQLALSAAQQPG